MDICIQVFMWTCVFISLGCVPKSGIAESHGNSTCHLWRNGQTFPKQLHFIHSHQQVCKDSNFSMSSSTLVIIYIFIIATLVV